MFLDNFLKEKNWQNFIKNPKQDIYASENIWPFIIEGIFSSYKIPFIIVTSTFDKNNELIIEGNKCSRGLEYAKSAYKTSPQVLFGRCLLSNASMGRLPVKTSRPIPENLKNQVMEQIRNTSIKAPVVKGQIIIKNILNLNIDVVSMRKVL